MFCKQHSIYVYKYVYDVANTWLTETKVYVNDQSFDLEVIEKCQNEL